MVDIACSKQYKQTIRVFTSQHQAVTVACRSEIARDNLEWQAGTEFSRFVPQVYFKSRV
jgi:hypothetical protein